MRLFAIPLLLFVAGSAKVCSSEDKAGGSSSASATVSGAASAAGQVKVAVVAPRIGGAVGSAGDFSVELAVHQNGFVEGLVSDAQGKLLNAGVKLTATVQAKGGAAEKLELGFSPARARFEGHAKAGVELTPGPVDVALEVAGKASTGRVSVAAVLPEPRLGGHVLAAGAFTAELFAGTGGEVRAFIKDSAGAEVKGDAGASFKAIVNAQGGAREAIALRFDAPRACFAGKATAGVLLAPGALELVVDAKVGAGIGRLESVALSVEASHGGQLVAVGDYSLELVVKGHEISAFAFDASGKAHVAGDLDLKLDVGQGLGTSFALKWDAPSLSYIGSAAANVNLALQPIRVSLVASGKAFVGAVASLSAAGKANANLKANVDVSADAKLDAAAKLSAKAQAKLDAAAKASAAKAASASVKITPPKLNLNLGTSQSAGAGAKAGGSAKAGAGVKAGGGLSLGTK